MIRCYHARLMGKHKMRISDMKRETGLSRKTTLALLCKEIAQKIDLDMQDKLYALFDCPLSDLLECVTN